MRMPPPAKKSIDEVQVVSFTSPSSLSLMRAFNGRVMSLTLTCPSVANVSQLILKSGCSLAGSVPTGLLNSSP